MNQKNKRKIEQQQKKRKIHKRMNYKGKEDELG